MRQLRQRADELLSDPTGIPSAADSTLLEAVPRAYRASLPATLALLVGELIKRTKSDVTVTIPPPPSTATNATEGQAGQPFIPTGSESLGAQNVAGRLPISPC
jgi:hypothetical protein